MKNIFVEGIQGVVKETIHQLIWHGVPGWQKKNMRQCWKNMLKFVMK